MPKDQGDYIGPGCITSIRDNNVDYRFEHQGIAYDAQLPISRFPRGMKVGQGFEIYVRTKPFMRLTIIPGELPKLTPEQLAQVAVDTRELTDLFKKNK